MRALFAGLLVTLLAMLLAGTLQAADPPADDAAKVNPRDRFADAATPLPRQPFADGKFALRPGEVIVMTGSANAVFEQQQGWLETLLALGAAAQKPPIESTMRHMSWEGDTVYEQSRAMNFGSWTDQFQAVGASTIIAWFGGVEALDDSRDDAEFAVAYGKLLDEFAATTPRVVVVSPAPFEKPAGRWVQDNSPRNARVQALAKIARQVAGERGAIYVDLFSPLAARKPDEPRLTEDGMHFTPAGQKIVADLIARQLGVNVSFSESQRPLRQEIIRKNRFWFDCWRTMNWAFPYGDRTWALFGKPIGEHPPLAKELEQYKPLIRNADERIHALALGQTPPPLPETPKRADETRQPPKEELKTLTPREGFEINLFASEGDGLVKPIQFLWDERGRLWALCVPSYPQLVPGVAANDYILVCEDTDGDGRADKFDRFAEGLVMPSGLALGDDGVYVCQATQLIHLRDTDGDRRADQQRVIFSGFGTGDSHQMINSLCWGPDGRLWFTQGFHINSKVETPQGLVECHSTGVWRMNPRTLELHNFLGNAAATENGWGVGFDDWGQAFYDPGNQPNAVYLNPALSPVPGRYLTKNQYAPIGSLAVSKAKGMEIEFIGSRHLPADLQGLMVKSIYMASYVDLHQIIDEASGFRSEPRGDLITSTSPMFRPLQTKVGLDGAIYFCDWCNPIIGHYQNSYRDPQRDHTHGRIWRMAVKDRAAVKPPRLDQMNPRELIAQLASPERTARQLAKEYLYRSKGISAVAEADLQLAKVLNGEPAPLEAEDNMRLAGVPADLTTQQEHFLYELTGVFAAHEAVRPQLIERLLASPEPRLRAFGAHMVGMWAERLPDPLAMLRRATVDPAPRVRMEAIVAASYVPSPAAVEVATLALSLPRDPWIDYALTETVLTLKPQWYPALAQGKLSFDTQADRLAFVLAADGTTDVTGFVRLLAEKPELTDDARAPLWALLGRSGTVGDLRYALDHGAGYPVVLDALAAAARQRNKIPAGDLVGPLKPRLTDADETLRAAAIGLAGAWHLKPLAADVRREIERETTASATRLAAIGAIAGIEGADALPLLSPLVAASNPLPVRSAAIRAIGAVDLAAAARLAAEQIPLCDSEAEMADFLLPIVDRRGGAEMLAKFLGEKPLGGDQAKLAHRALSAAGHAETDLIAVLNRSLGISGATPEYNAALVEQIAAAAAGQGDARRGRQVFESKLANCAACHKVAGQGGDIGPDLSVAGLGLSTPMIVESLLWPNRQVKEGFLATRVVTSEGQIFTGYKLKDTAEEVQLRDITTREVRSIPKEDVEALAPIGSVMPAGLTAGMTDGEVHDLVRYLSELGRTAR